MKYRIIAILLCVAFVYGCNSQSQNDEQTQQTEQTAQTEKADTTTSSDGINREYLPIQPPKTDPITEMDARNVETPERFEVKAPEGAPNVVVVLIDDIGFGATSTFGGPIETPTFDTLAENNIRYN